MSTSFSSPISSSSLEDISLASLEADLQRETATLYSHFRVLGADHSLAMYMAESIGPDAPDYSIEEL